MPLMTWAGSRARLRTPKWRSGLAGDVLAQQPEPAAALGVFEPIAGDRGQDRLARHEGVQGVPAVVRQDLRLLAAGAEAGHPGNGAAEVEAPETEADARARAGEVQDEQNAARPQHAEVLAERVPQVHDVTDRVSHAEEVKGSFAEGQPLGHPLNERDAELPARLAEHSSARVQARHRARWAHDARCGAGDGARTDGDVEDLHPLREPGASQRKAAVPSPRAQGHEPGDAVVVGGGVVEDLREEATALGLVLVVLPEDGVRRHLARIAIHCSGGRAAGGTPWVARARCAPAPVRLSLFTPTCAGARAAGALRGWPVSGALGVIQRLVAERSCEREDR